MSTSVFWTLPTRHLDAKLRTRRASGITDPRPGRFGPYGHLTQVARAAEASGFTGLFIPYDPLGEDSWIVATTLAREVPRLQLLPEFQPGFATAVYTAKLALSFQRFFADRLSWKLALHTDPSQQAAVGDLADAAAARPRADELLTIVDGVWHSSPFTFTGEHFEVEAGGFFEGVADAAGGFTIARHPRPDVYLDGNAEADFELSARWADVHVFDTLDPGALSEQIDRLAAAATQHGRNVRVALRLGVLARERGDEAWRDARRSFAEHDSSRPFDELRGQGLRWSGFDHLGASVSDGLVGSYDDLADELAHYHELGVSTFLLEGAKHLEDVYHLGEFMLPNIAGSRASRALEPQP